MVSLTVAKPDRSEIKDPQTRKAIRRDWAGLAVLMLPVLLISIDGTVMNLALPEISLEFGSSGTLLLWIIDAYSLVLAGLLVTMGSLADRFGRRRMLLIGATGFGVVSVLVAFASAGIHLVAIRALLGFFGAMLMPATLSLIRNMFEDRQQRRLALAVWASCFSAGAALGPVIGGILLRYFSWHSVFLIAVPLLIPMLILTPLVVSESKDPNPGPASVLNVILSLFTLAPLVYAIKVFTTEGFVAPGVMALTISLVAGIWFTLRQLTSEVPMLDLRLFQNVPFTGAVLTNLLSVFALAGFLYFVSQHLQLVLGLEPLEAGLTLLPGTLIMMISGLAVVAVAKRVPVNKIVSLAVLLVAISYALFAVVGQNAGAVVIGGLFCLLAIGPGAAETLTNDMIISAVPANKAGAASAISETAYEVGAALGTAVLGSILVATYRSSVVIPAGLSAEQAELAQETLGGAVVVSEQLPSSLGESLLHSAHAAFDSGIVAVGAIGAVLMMFVSVMAWKTLKQPSAAKQVSAAVET